MKQQPQETGCGYCWCMVQGGRTALALAECVGERGSDVSLDGFARGARSALSKGTRTLSRCHVDQYVVFVTSYWIFGFETENDSTTF